MQLRSVVAVSLLAAAMMLPAHANAQPLPEIRMHAQNRVPACTTPPRLMRFLRARNHRLHPRYDLIAAWYQHWGEVWRVRWDYAFFQMLLETNFLTYRRGNGKPGDVHPRQYNFAGLGATGGGVSGDRFPNVRTGVLAQIHHLVAYSGERLAQPSAPRTKLKQDVIIRVSLRLGRNVRFSDLSGRWAADRKYHTKIARLAAAFGKQYCARRPHH